MNILNNIKKIIKDTLYVSKITKTNNKKLIILSAVILSQLSAIADIIIILFFTFIITGQLMTNDLLLPILESLFSIKIILPTTIFLRYLFNYSQMMIIKNLELNVQKNLKVHLMKEIFDKRNYSVADAYFYINTLTTHISFFYSSFAAFLNHLLQIFAFSAYLFFSDPKTISTFALGVLILFYPILYLIKKAREFMHESYVFGQDSNVGIQRVVDNMFLIKLVNKESEEISRFSKTLDKLNESLFNNHKFGVLNSFLPSFITIFILSILSLFSNLAKSITLDFIGITLRLFQSVGNLTTAMNQIINSHVHIDKFYQLEFSKTEINRSNFIIEEKTKTKSIIKFEDVSFKYINSEEMIFENINLDIKDKSHTLITGANGTGKSTLLGLMSGVFYPTKGKVRTSTGKFGYVGATPLIFTASLKDNILYGNKLEIEDTKIIEKLREFETFNEESGYDLKRIVDNKSLSSGQTQKIAFIRALLMDLDVLLLDESTANLDDKSRDLIFGILKNSNITVINSTHDYKNFDSVDSHYNIEISDEKRILKSLK